MSRFLSAITLFIMSTLCSQAGQYRLYIGTYTNEAGSAGIYTLTLDSDTGRLSEPILAAAALNPTFLCLHPTLGVLYATGEIDGAYGGFKSYRIDPTSGLLTASGERPVSARNAACHVAVSPDGKYLAGANYNAAWVATMPLDPDGTIGPVASLITQEGTLGPRKARQDKAHAHSTQFSPDGHTLFACDLGLDSIITYKIEAATGVLTPSTVIRSASGAGPRHSRPSADGRLLYVLNELSGSLDVFTLTGQEAPALLESHPCLAPDFAGENSSAEVAIHPSGRFLYASNRGPDTVTVFQVNPTTGRLTLVGRVPSGGRHPRHFGLSPDGNWMVCANRDTNSLVLFRIDPATGLPSPTGTSVRVPQAVCVVFKTLR